MTNLEQTLSDLEKAREVASRDPNEYSIYSRPGIEAAIRQAKDSIERLEGNYSKALLANAVGIFMMGDSDKIKQFTDICEAAGDGVRVDASALYTRIAARVEPTLGSNRVFGATQATVAVSELMDVALELHVASLKRPEFGEAVRVPTLASLAAVIRHAVRGAVNDDLNRMSIERAATEAALKVRYIGNVAPVYVVNAISDEVVGLGKNFGRGATSLTIGADDEVTKEFVKEKLKEVNRKLKKAK